MIIVKNRELLIPNNERYIGTTYDNETENRVFQVPRFSQRGVDLANLTFRLDIQYANESYDTVVLDKEVGEAFIILIWRITSATLQVPGTLYIGLRAIDDEATVKWSSFSAAMYAERHLNTPGNYGGSLTEIEQMEQDHQYMKGVVDELKANIDYAHDAEAWAQGTRSGTAVPSTDKTYHKNSKYYSEQANTKATAAANSATQAANSATQAAETVADTNTRFNNAVAAVTVNTEVQDARVGADGTTYTVLKNRLDAEHTQLKNAFAEYNSTNVLGYLHGVNRTHYGITFQWNADGSCAVSGVATATAFSNLYYNTTAMPPYIKAGDRVYVKVSSTNPSVSLQMWFYKNGAYLSGNGFRADTAYDIPSDAEGMLIRLQVDNGATVNASVRFAVLTAYTNAELYESLSENVLRKRLLEMAQSGLPSCDLNTVISGAYILGEEYTYENAPPQQHIGFLLAYNTASLILQVFYSFNGTKVWKRRYVGGAWSEWILIGSEIKEYTFNNYESTYNVTATPTITASSENYLAPSGDTTDRTADIVTMLTSGGVCRLGPGNYYVKDLVMPNNTSIIGCGAATHIIRSGTDAGFAIKLGSRCTVKDCWIFGTETEITPSATLGDRHGILWQGTYTENQKAPIRGMVSGLHITGFSGGGITCYDTGYAVNTCMEVDDCYIYNCGAGINISYWSEFNKFSNVHCSSNYYGCINNGGNNTFIGCDFSGNKLGFLMDNSSDQSPNNSHGSAVGCVFNHTNSNTGIGIKILNCDNGYIFTGCQIFFSQIDIEDSDGVVISSTNFGASNCNITIKNGGAILFANNMHQAVPTIAISNNSNVHFSNCYVRSTGEVVTN